MSVCYLKIGTNVKQQQLTILFQEHLKDFDQKLLEERKRRLKERKERRKEERRRKWIEDKEESEQRAKDEALKRGQTFKVKIWVNCNPHSSNIKYTVFYTVFDVISALGVGDSITKGALIGDEN